MRPFLLLNSNNYKFFTFMNRARIQLFMKHLITLLIISFPSYLLANDGAYYMSGNQLIPMHQNNISVAKERLSIVRDGDYINVNVHYEFMNHGDEKEIIVGFEAFPPDGDVDWKPANGEHPYMENFLVEMNGIQLNYDVAFVPYDYIEQAESHKDNDAYYCQDGAFKSQFNNEDLVNSDDYEPIYVLYVYHFKAKFVAGLNVVKHSYRFKMSGSVMTIGDFDYVLQAVNRWGEGGIDDFRMEIDMGNLVEFSVYEGFFNHGNEWLINGIGENYGLPHYSNFMNSEEDITTFAIQEGSVVFEQKNFKPTDDLHLFIPAYGTFIDGFDPDTKELSLNLPYDIYNIRSKEYHKYLNLDKLSPLAIKVLQNYPFARRGYEFSDAELQDFYNKQVWYIANSDYEPDLAALSEEELALYNVMKSMR